MIFSAMRHSHAAENSRAFTLLELMVVISIIGLLASVILASLSGARIKAENSRINQLVEQYETAFRWYETEHGTIPIITGTNDWVCVGTGYPNAKCRYISGQPAVESSELTSDLLPYIKDTNTPATTVLNFGSSCSAEDVQDWGCVENNIPYVGISYVCSDHTNNVCTRGGLMWGLRGSDRCTVPNAITIRTSNDTVCILPLVGSGSAIN